MAIFAHQKLYDSNICSSKVFSQQYFDHWINIFAYQKLYDSNIYLAKQYLPSKTLLVKFFKSHLQLTETFST